jgi:putative glutamine amidotransferase
MWVQPSAAPLLFSTEEFMRSPLIGITTYRTKNPAGNPIMALAEHYVQSISRAGGNPVLIPLGLPETQLTSLTAQLDGILFSGGGDIGPESYSVESSPVVKGVDPDRDRVEIQMVRSVISMGLPFLGICRGLQVINVALGGTLYTHIANQHPNAIKHSYNTGWPRDHLPHDVKVNPASRLASILGTISPGVNSLHHQGIRVLAPGLKVSAIAPDELIEGIELPDHPFGLAVQWHPEWLPAHRSMRQLFLAFVEAATH